jgi:O-acetyl-ADP-ribose deacetylase (regulator of RNase III)
VDFKKRFGRVGELKAQNVEVGSVATLYIEEEKRWVYYLVTKEHYNGKPTMETLRASLVACRTHAIEKGVKCIAMPRIGCGLDRLNWSLVKRMIDEVFEESGIEIKIYCI